MKKQIFWLFAGLLLVCQSAALKPDPTGKDVLNKYIQAIGGQEQLKKVKSLQINSSAEVMGMVITGTTYKKAPNKFANLMLTPMGEFKQIYDGKKALATGMMQTEVVEGAGMENIKMIASPFPELDFLGKDFTVELKGKATIGTKETYQVEITSTKGAKVMQWYATDTGLKVQEQVGKTITQYEEYKAVEGIKFPHTLLIDMQMPVNLKVSKIAINITLADSLFEQP